MASSHSTPSSPRSADPHHIFPRILLTATIVGLALFFREVWMSAFLAIILACLMGFPVRFFSRFLPRGAATLLTLGLLVSAVYFAAPLLFNPLVRETRQAEERIPEAVDKAKHWLNHLGNAGSPMGTLPRAAITKEVEQKTQNFAGTLVEKLSAAALQATSFGATLVITFVLALFFVYEPETYRSWFRALVPRQREPDFDKLWTHMGGALHRWIGGILTSMIIMGAFTALGLRLAGVQNWLLLGLLTFAGTFVPYVGAIASAAPGLLVALAQSNQAFAGACVVYLAVHLIEGYVVDPLVMRRAVVIQPAVLLLWQIAMTAVFGIAGVVVATPLYVCLKCAVDQLYVERLLKKAPYPPEHKAA